MRRLRSSTGQAGPFLVVVGTPLLLIVAALVMDVGSWFLVDRRMQAGADAAALAAVQELPGSQADARTVAIDFSQRNGSDVPTVSFPTARSVEVATTKVLPTVFSRLLGITEVRVGARARAGVSAPANIRRAAPIVVPSTQEKLDPAKGCPCYDSTTVLSLTDANAAGSGTFGLADIGRVGNPGASVLSSWITEGLSGSMPGGEWYDAVTGEKIGQIRSAIEATIGKVLLFPVYDAVDAPNRKYHVIGWAAFVIHAGGVKWNGNTRQLTGHFVEAIVEGEYDPDATSDYGVRVTALVD